MQITHLAQFAAVLSEETLVSRRQHRSATGLSCATDGGFRQASCYVHGGAPLGSRTARRRTCRLGHDCSRCRRGRGSKRRPRPASCPAVSGPKGRSGLSPQRPAEPRNGSRNSGPAGSRSTQPEVLRDLTRRARSTKSRLCSVSASARRCRPRGSCSCHALSTNRQRLGFLTESGTLNCGAQTPQLVRDTDRGDATDATFVGEKPDWDRTGAHYMECVDDVGEAQPSCRVCQPVLIQITSVEGATGIQELARLGCCLLATRARCSQRCCANGRASSVSGTRSSCRLAMPSNVLASANL